MGLISKLLDEKAIQDLTKIAEPITKKWNEVIQKNFEDHRKIAELLGEILKKLDEIKEQNERK